jgi:hypothetical protein
LIGQLPSLVHSSERLVLAAAGVAQSREQLFSHVGMANGWHYDSYQVGISVFAE